MPYLINRIICLTHVEGIFETAPRQNCHSRSIRAYNRAHSATRVVVEHANGRLKGNQSKDNEDLI